MKTTLFYLIGTIGILFSLTSIQADEIIIVEDNSTVSTDRALNKNIEIKSIDKTKTTSDTQADNELIYDGFARNYYEKEPDITGWESIAYSIDYLKSSFNIFNNDSGFYGSIGFTYIYDIYDDTKSQRERNNFKQEYTLGYRGDVYSPKLLKYLLSTTIRYEDIEDKVNNITNKNKIESYDYEARLNFLSSTRIPFSLYALKIQKPNTIFYENTKGESLYDDLSLGLSGQINLNIFKINYSVSDSKGRYEDIFSKDDREIRIYKTTLTKETQKHHFRLSYDNTEQKIDRDSINYNSKSYIGNENVSLIYRAKLSDSLRFNTQSYYRIVNYTDNLLNEYETKSILTNLNLSWNPRGKHSASLSMNGSNIKDENKILNTNTSIDNIQVAQSYGYRMSKNLSLSQSSSYAVVFSDLNTIENINFSSNVNYTTKINSDLTLNISASGGINSNSNDTDTNTSIVDYTSYIYSANTRIYQVLSSINSRASIGFGYSGSINTRDETKQSYIANFNLDTAFNSVMRNQLSVNYVNDNMKNISSIDATLVSRESNRLTVKDEVEYRTRVGIRGMFKSKVSIEYLLAQTTDSGDIDKLMPRADILFKYRLSQKIRHTSKFNIYKEVFYDTTSYNFGTDLRFTSGKLNAYVEYIYNKTVVGEDIDIFDRDTHRITMNFKRKF